VASARLKTLFRLSANKAQCRRYLSVFSAANGGWLKWPKPSDRSIIGEAMAAARGMAWLVP